MKNYCHLCGAKYLQGKTNPQECSSCGNLSFENSIPCAEIALFDDRGRVLLAVRGEEPNKGKYDLPGGFVIYGETVETALHREIKEELGLDVQDYETPQFCSSWTFDYPFSRESYNTLSLTFASKLKTTDKIVASDDVSEVEFFDINELDSLEFSWSGYPELIRKAHAQLFG